MRNHRQNHLQANASFCRLNQVTVKFGCRCSGLRNNPVCTSMSLAHDSMCCNYVWDSEDLNFRLDAPMRQLFLGCASEAAMTIEVYG
jgi:hypothetical protein